jgi:hypothetical protein
MAEPLRFPSPISSPFAPWPVDLMATLDRSLQAHTPANRYLDNAFWYQERWGNVPPRSIDDALNRLGAESQNALRTIHMRAFLTGLWTYVVYIGNIWTGTAPGLNFVCWSKSALRTFLQRSPAFCVDDALMGLRHQGKNSSGFWGTAKNLFWNDGPTQSWREVVDGDPGLHVCIPGRPGSAGDDDQGECSMHVDPHQIVLSKEPLHPMCHYSPLALIGHAKDQ